MCSFTGQPQTLNGVSETSITKCDTGGSRVAGVVVTGLHEEKKKKCFSLPFFIPLSTSFSPRIAALPGANYVGQHDCAKPIDTSERKRYYPERNLNMQH